MNPPAVILSVLAVVLVWVMGPIGDQAPTGTDDERRLVRTSTLSALAMAAVAWGAVAVMADPLAEALSVTAPTVRVAAGVGLLIVSLVRTWSKDPHAPATRTDPGRLGRREAAPGKTGPVSTGGNRGNSGNSGNSTVTVEAMVRGPARVEVGMVVWSLTLDHGTAAGLLTVGGLAVLSARAACAGRNATWTGAPGRATVGVAGAAVAVLLTLTGVLGL